MDGRKVVGLAALGMIVGLGAIAGCGRVPKEAVPPAPPSFPVARPVTDEVTDYEEFPGSLTAFRSVDVRPQVGGYLVDVLFKDGAQVEEGAALFQIDPRPYQAEVERNVAAVRRAEAHLARIEADARRATNLFARAAINREEADRSAGDYAESKAALASASASLEAAKIDLDRTTVRTLIGGQVSRRMVDPGALVHAGTMALTTVVALDPIYVDLKVDEATLRRLSGFSKSVGHGEHELTALAGLADQPGEFPYPVTISFSDNQMNAASGTLEIRGTIANPLREDGLRMFVPGMYARVRVPVGAPRQATLVPERSLGTDQGRKFLYVVGTDGKVAYRPVTIGPAHKGMRVIEEGLGPLEQYVANDVSRITPGMVVTPVAVADPWALAGNESTAPPSSAQAPFAAPPGRGPSPRADADPSPGAPASANARPRTASPSTGPPLRPIPDRSRTSRGRR
jgi:RND family efflux transporter MFP subunit